MSGDSETMCTVQRLHKTKMIRQTDMQTAGANTVGISAA